MFYRHYPPPTDKEMGGPGLRSCAGSPGGRQRGLQTRSTSRAFSTSTPGSVGRGMEGGQGPAADPPKEINVANRWHYQGT